MTASDEKNDCAEVPKITFTDYQKIVEQTDERKQRVISMLGLVGEIGDLHSSIKKLLLQPSDPHFRSELREEFGDVLWYLTSLAALYDIPLAEIAAVNAKKAELLYSEGSKPNFDSKYPPDERIPRQFSVNFYEKPLDQSLYVRISINGVAIGDELTDNSREDDGYRYHDVFHLAYAAVLGWSPVTRRMLKCKRKSNATVDEVEDGARAAIIEEAISLLVFNQAVERGWYEDSKSISTGLFKVIQKMTAALEVKACTAKQWQKAIIQGYAAFKQLRDNGGGNVVIDLDVQKLVYKAADAR